MAGKNSGSTSLQAVLARLVDESARSSNRTANVDVVLGALSRSGLGVSTGNTNADEEVVEVTVLVHESSLFAVVQSLIVGDLVRSVGANLERRLKLNLVDIAPERSKVKVLFAINLDPVWVNAIVGAVLWNANTAVIGPGTRGKGL